VQTIGEVQFVMDTHGEIVRNAPFMVRVDNTVEFYEGEPGVLAQIDDNPPRAYFEARRKPDGDLALLIAR
jgi:hypothetical protein